MYLKKIPHHVWIAASSWISRVVSAVIQIACIRVIVSLVGNEGYAAFVLLSALLAWGALADFGVGNALQNYVSERRAAGKNYIQFILCSGILVCLLVVFVISILFVLSPLLSALYLKNFDAILVGEKSIIFFVAVTLFCITSVSNVLFKIWFAELRGWISNIFTCCCSLLGFIGIYSLQFLTLKPDVLGVLAVFYGPLALLPCLYFMSKYFVLIKRFKIKKSYMLVVSKLIWSRANGFFIFSFMGTLVLQADYLVMSQKLSANDIVVYSIMMRLFGFVFFIYSALLQAIWPVCIEFRIKKEWGKLNSIVRNNIVLGLVLIAVSTVMLYYLHEYILRIMVPTLDHDLSWVLFALFALYFSLRVWSDTFAMLLQSMNYLKPLWLLVPVQAVLSIAIQWFLTDKFGLYGIVGGLVLSFVCTVAIFVPVFYWKKMRVLIYA